MCKGELLVERDGEKYLEKTDTWSVTDRVDVRATKSLRRDRTGRYNV